MYGVSNTLDMEMFVYASKMTCRLVVPAANLTGTMYRGKLRFGQLFRGTLGQTQADLYVTVSDLIRASDHIQAMQTEFSLHSAMVNDYILASQVRSTQMKFSDYIKQTDLAMEIIDYVVLQTPSISITDGVFANYSLICELESNVAIYPSPMNLVLYRTFNTISHRKQVKEIDYSFAPVDYKILDKAKPPTNYAELNKLEDKMDADHVIRESHTPQVDFNDAIEENDRDKPDEEETLVKMGKPNRLRLKSVDSEEVKWEIHFAPRIVSAMKTLVRTKGALLARIGVKVPFKTTEDFIHGMRQGFEIAKGLITSISSKVANASKDKKFVAMLEDKVDKAKGKTFEEQEVNARKAIRKEIVKMAHKKKPRANAEVKRLASQIINGKLTLDKVPENLLKDVQSDLQNYITKKTKTNELSEKFKDKIAHVRSVLA